MLKQITFPAILALILLGGCSDSSQTSRGDGANALIATTAFHLQTIDGQALDVTKEGANFVMEGAAEPVVIYDIYATWCRPCRTTAPHLSSLQTKFAGKIKIVGISIEEGESDAHFKQFAEELGINYTLVNSPDNRKLSSAIAGTLDVGAEFPIPLMVIYDKGRYVKHYTGIIPEEMLESDIRQLLEP